MRETGFAWKLRAEILRRKRIFYYVNGNDLQCVIRNLKFVYYSIIASENLLICAIEQLKLERKPVYNRDMLLSYFVEHLVEERGHAKWLFDDLTSHGVMLDDFDLNAAAMIGSQYYMIYHKDPFCLLGHLAVVEGTPTPLAEIEKLESIYGSKLFRFARFHAIKDDEHKNELFRQINNIPPEYTGDVARSASVSLDFIERASKEWGMNNREMGSGAVEVDLEIED